MSDVLETASNPEPPEHLASSTDGHTGRDPGAVGRIIGHYRILRTLGRGGVGAVYLAERADGEFAQHVALKLIKRGMDSDAVLRGFVEERRILASLAHPHIARLIDSGTAEDGAPFLVLEYVDGVDIAEFAESNQLTRAERVALFLSVCDAVSFAHRHLVIHGDVKPSNILVTARGDVKLLDFGIARRHGAEDVSASTAGNLYTPAYASPEQLRGQRLTTATDVYSLGVVLHEVLTGARPHHTEAASRRPAQPAGDLHNIIRKALRDEPAERYESVELLAEDLRCYQRGLPVTASAGSWAYRAKKFVRRNRMPVGAAALVVLTMVGAFGVSSWQYQVAARARDDAQRRSENLRRLSNTFVSDVERAIRDLPGSMPARRKLLERAVAQLDALAADSSGATSLQLDLVWAYQNLASMPDATLGERAQLYRKTFDLIGTVRPQDAADIAVRDRLAMMHLDYLFVTRSRLDIAGTIEHSRRAVEIVDEELREFPTRPDLQDSFWTAHYHEALTFQQLGQADQMTAAARLILPVAEFLHRENPPLTDQYNFMKPHLTRLAIGYGLAYAGKYDQAITEFKTALTECLAEQARRPDAEILRRNESNIRLQLANALAESERFDEAFIESERALAIRDTLVAANPTNFDHRLAVADGHYNVGRVHLRAGAFTRAETSLRSAGATFARLVEQDPERSSTRLALARNQIALGAALISRRSAPEATTVFEAARTFLESVGAAGSADAGLARAHAEVVARLAMIRRGASATAAQGARDATAARSEWESLNKRNVIRASDRVVIADLDKVRVRPLPRAPH